MPRIPGAVRSALADTAVDRIDAGSGAGVIQIRSGTQPATADDAATGTLLVAVTLNDPAFGSASLGVATMDSDPVPSGVAVATGIATWARILDSSGATVMDVSVTATGDGGELTLATTSIVSGATVTISSGTVTEPAS